MGDRVNFLALGFFVADSLAAHDGRGCANDDATWTMSEGLEGVHSLVCVDHELVKVDSALVCNVAWELLVEEIHEHAVRGVRLVRAAKQQGKTKRMTHLLPVPTSPKR